MLLQPIARLRFGEAVPAGYRSGGVVAVGMVGDDRRRKAAWFGYPALSRFAASTAK
jgi:hypothetical protein